MLRYSAILLSILLVAGCDKSITLRNDKTGKEARCGGMMVLPGQPSNAERCAKMMEGAGYKQVGEKP